LNGLPLTETAIYLSHVSGSLQNLKGISRGSSSDVRFLVAIPFFGNVNKTLYPFGLL